MGEGRYSGAEDFPEQVHFWLRISMMICPSVILSPKSRTARGPTPPEVWLLGSSITWRARSQLGLNFAFAHFISADGGDRVMRDYKRHFQPSRRGSQPQALLTYSRFAPRPMPKRNAAREYRSAAPQYGLRPQSAVPESA